jgi:hypothetical protein
MTVTKCWFLHWLTPSAFASPSAFYAHFDSAAGVPVAARCERGADVKRVLFCWVIATALVSDSRPGGRSAARLTPIRRALEFIQRAGRAWVMSA